MSLFRELRGEAAVVVPVVESEDVAGAALAVVVDRNLAVVDSPEIASVAVSAVVVAAAVAEADSTNPAEMAEQAADAGCSWQRPTLCSNGRVAYGLGEAVCGWDP